MDYNIKIKYIKFCNKIKHLHNLVSLSNIINLFCSCQDPADDPFAPCFGCESSKNDVFQTRFDRFNTFYSNVDYYPENLIDRQIGEAFQTTSQSRRLVCQNRATAGTGRSCKLRVDKMMQIRRRSYGRALEFAQNEQYLSDDDLDILRRLFQV